MTEFRRKRDIHSAGIQKIRLAGILMVKKHRRPGFGLEDFCYLGPGGEGGVDRRTARWAGYVAGAPSKSRQFCSKESYKAAGLARSHEAH